MDKVWEELHSTREWGQYPPEYIVRYMARNYYNMDRSRIRVLDFGCGAGANTWYLAREGFDVYAFDGSESAVAKAKRKLERDGLSADIIVCEGCRLQYEQDFFDAVIDCVCIYSNILSDIRNMYKSIYDVLKSGGKLLTSCFGTNTDGYGTGKCIEYGTYDHIQSGRLKGCGTSHFYKKEELSGLLYDTGFCNIKVDTDLYTDDESKVELFIASAEKP